MSYWVKVLVVLFAFCLPSNVWGQQSNLIINDIQFAGYKKNKLSYLKKFIHSARGQSLDLDKIKYDDCLLYTSPSPRD